jgi:isoquinoline 1-oxidoreductase subunit beta
MKIFQKAIAQKVSGEVSRRALLTGGLAGGFLLAFHLPLRALTPNEPVQPPDDTRGKFAPNAFIRIDRPHHAGDAAG